KTESNTVNVGERGTADTATAFLDDMRMAVIVAKEAGVFGGKAGFVGACVHQHRKQKPFPSQQILDAGNDNGWPDQSRVNERHESERLRRIQTTLASGRSKTTGTPLLGLARCNLRVSLEGFRSRAIILKLPESMTTVLRGCALMDRLMCLISSW